ncbi:MAG: DNA-methyltransferase [Paraclostridium sp.]
MNKLYLGDNIKVMDLLIEENVQVDLTVTSPPYDDLRDYNNTLVWNFEVFKQVADRLYKITKTGGVVVWVVGDKTKRGTESLTSFRQALYFKEIGFNVNDTMIYAKNNPVPNKSGKRYQNCFEYMFILSKGKPNTFNPLLRARKNKNNDKRTQRELNFNRGKDGEFRSPKLYKVKEFVMRENIWYYNVGLNNTTTDKIAFNHPATMPEQLALDHILSWSNENDVVFDPFMGSGTTIKMAIQSNRNFIGIEKVKEYIDITLRRTSLDHVQLIKV